MRLWTLQDEARGFPEHCRIKKLTWFYEGKLRLEPTVVGLSKFNESVQKLKNGQVAGYVLSKACEMPSLTGVPRRIVVDFNLP